MYVRGEYFVRRAKISSPTAVINMYMTYQTKIRIPRIFKPFSLLAAVAINDISILRKIPFFFFQIYTNGGQLFIAALCITIWLQNIQKFIIFLVSISPLKNYRPLNFFGMPQSHPCNDVIY